jgi:sporulation integral membrane protein YtvI
MIDKKDGFLKGGKAMEGEFWKKWAAILICGVLGGVGALFALRFLFPVVLPFLLGWLVARIIRKPARRLAKPLRLSSRGVAVVLMLGLLTGIALLVGYGSRRLVLELKHFLEGLLEENGGFYGAVESGLAFLRERLRSLGGGRAGESGELQQQLQEMLIQVAGDLLSSLSAYLSTLAGRLLSALPTGLLVSIITVVSGVYFCLEGEEIEKKLLAFVPHGVRNRLPKWKAGAGRMLRHYLRAYLLLLLITLGALLLGFLVLGVPYPLLLATLTALVDLLPVLGVGTVLLPWAAVLFLQRKIAMGAGLLILYGGMLILRQILEPRLLGKSLGVHPLFALFASFAGLRLFGILGMILGPMVVSLGKSFFAERREEESG